MEISGHTQMLCLIGSPVGHSGSPAMYNYSFQKLGLDYVYLAFDIKEEDTSKAINALRLAITRTVWAGSETAGSMALK